MTAKSSHELIRIAILEHLRHWWASDGLFHRGITRNDGKICQSTLRKIASAYGVSRGLLKGKEKHIAKDLDQHMPKWPDNLLERAAFVRKLAETAQKSGMTRGIQLSAFSKIVWFARPEGWTLYDSFAREGLQSSRYADGNDEYDKYYRMLNTLHFENAMDVGRKVVSLHSFPYLWPERIHDKYLMFLGHDEERNKRVIDVGAQERLIELWQQFHGVGVIDEIEIFVEAFIKELGDHPAFQIHTLEDG